MGNVESAREAQRHEPRFASRHGAGPGRSGIRSRDKSPCFDWRRDSWCAGQDIRETFRDLDNKPVERARNSRNSHHWRWGKLYTYPKPTIAMVNGFVFGGGFTPLIACDFAIAAEDATFGLAR